MSFILRSTMTVYQISHYSLLDFVHRPVFNTKIKTKFRKRQSYLKQLGFKKTEFVLRRQLFFLTTGTNPVPKTSLPFTPFSRTSSTDGCRGFKKSFPSLTVPIHSSYSHSIPLSFQIFCTSSSQVCWGPPLGAPEAQF